MSRRRAKAAEAAYGKSADQQASEKSWEEHAIEDRDTYSREEWNGGGPIRKCRSPSAFCWRTFDASPWAGHVMETPLCAACHYVMGRSPETEQTSVGDDCRAL